MRTTVASLLVVLAFGIFMPVSIHVSSSSDHHVLMTLDVCHVHSASAPGMSEVPVIPETLVMLPASGSSESIVVSSLPVRDLFTPSLEELPPKA